MKASKDIIRLFIYSFFSNLYLERNIFVIFLLYKGLSLAQIMIGQMVINISMTVSEIPTGLISDFIGKKKGLLIGSFLVITYYFFLLFAENFVLYLLAACCLGVGSTFVSGTDEAYLYTLLDNNKLNESSLKYLGRLNSIITISSLIAIIIGGLIQKVNWTILIILCFFSQLLSLMFLLSINDTTHNNKFTLTQKPISILNEYILVLKSNNYMKGFLLFIGFHFGMVSAIILLTQDVLMKFGLQTELIAIFFFIDNVLSAILYRIIEKITSIIEKMKLINVCFLMSMVGFCCIMASNVYIVMTSVIVLNLASSLAIIVLFDVYSTNLNDSIRATGISFYNMISALIMAVIFATASLFNDIYLSIVCIGGALITFGCIIFVIKSKKAIVNGK